MASVLTPSRAKGTFKNAGIPKDLVWPLSVDQYHRMIDAGILDEDDPVELLDGFLVFKMPKKRRHSLATRRLRKQLEKPVGKGWYVDSQEPITMDTSEPEPDLLVIRGQDSDYPDRHPGPDDASLVIEVAESTLDRDRGWKRAIYAKTGIPVYWIVNLVDDQIEVYSGLKGRGEKASYGDPSILGIDDSAPVILDGKKIGSIAVKSVIP